MKPGEFSELLMKAEAAPAERRGECLRRLRDVFLQASADLSAQEVAGFEAVACQILPGLPILERVTFAKALARSPRLPHGLRDHLLADVAMVKAPIIEHAEMTDDELIGLIDLEDEPVCLNIARRSRLGDRVTDLLIGAGNPKVLMTLVLNLEAQFSFSGFDMLSDVAIEDQTMDEALSARSDLPPEIGRKLTRALERRTRQRISEMMERDKAKTRRPFILR